MARRHQQDHILTKPLPSTTFPTLVIFALVACLWLCFKFFFGAPERLLGGPPPPNEYIHYLHEPKPVAPTVVIAPASTPPSAGTAATTPPTATADHLAAPALPAGAAAGTPGTTEHAPVTDAAPATAAPPATTNTPAPDATAPAIGKSVIPSAPSTPTADTTTSPKHKTPRKRHQP
jgi:hypothetical protein